MTDERQFEFGSDERSEFEKWVSAIGPVEAARRISSFEESRNRKPVRYQQIQEWLTSEIPAVRVLAVEAASGIDRAILSPHDHGPPLADLSVGT